MTENFLKLNILKSNQRNWFIRSQFGDVIHDYNFFYISEKLIVKDDEKQTINQNIKDSSLITIDQNEKLNEEINKECLIFGFEKTLIILERSSINFLYDLLSKNPNLLIYCLSNTKNIFMKQVQNKIIESDIIFNEEIKSFVSEFDLNCESKKLLGNIKFWTYHRTRHRDNI